MRYDVAIIGGGAAGLCAAIRIKQLNRNAGVILLEQLSRVGKKLITTGNGRCNITNAEITLERYHGETVTFAEKALKRFPNTAAEEFFCGIGINFVYDEVGRAYPYSLQASSVVDMLRFAADEAGVVTLTDTKVTDIKAKKNGFTLECEEQSIECLTVLVASGLYSGGDKLGSDGSVLRIMRDRLGYRTVKTTPAIVQLKTAPEAVRSLKGIKVNARVLLEADSKVIRKDRGEVLFCDYGLSGPPIMQLSRAVERDNRKFTVCLDLMPEYNFERLCGLLQARINALKTRTLEDFFTGLLNKRVGQYILKSCSFALSDSVGLLSGKEKMLAAAIKQMRFDIKGTTGFINSQVTAGGLDTAQFYDDTMMSRKHRGLFAAGEILDIDGDCGGFNLQWAWSSALTAADGICRLLKENHTFSEK